jgi:glycosyltransferase involved in cell wall biosynthesis
MIEISVIIASVESAQSIERCIESVRAAIVGKSSEIIVVDASRDASADIAIRTLGSAGTAGTAHVMRCAPGTLTPELWAAGIARSKGRVIALTTGHFVVEPTWVRSLETALNEGQVGAAGRIDLGNETSVTDWATFYLRYSEFLNEPGEMRRGVPGIPADNAAYDGDAIRRFVATSDDGFWEVEFHRQLHALGRSLAVVPGATARYSRSFPFGTIARHRFHHGRHSGAWRVMHTDRASAMVVAVAPLVPLALAARVWRRVQPLASHRRRFLRALPTFLALAACWAIGEAVGAVGGAPASRRPSPLPA